MLLPKLWFNLAFSFESGDYADLGYFTEDSGLATLYRMSEWANSS